MSDISDPAPLFSNVDIFSKDESNEDLFSSALNQSIETKPTGPGNNINPLPDLPTLQLSVDKGPPQTPIEETVPEDVGYFSPDMPPSEPSILQLGQNGEASDQFMQISVHNGSRMGEGIAAYITYRVDTKTNIPIFKKNNFSVIRRFSDFLGLHDKLVEKYLRAGRIIPPAPEKSVIGMTKIKMTGPAEQNASSSEFIERRRASLERYLQRTVAHPVLGVDPDFREFLEIVGDLPRATNTIALSGAGVMRLFNKVGETVNKITYKMDENDPWFEAKMQDIECLENGLRRLHNSVEGLVAARRDLAVYTGTLAKSCAMLSSCEEHSSLSRCLASLAELEEKIEGLHSSQANSDFYFLCEILKDYISLIGAVKEVFHERVKVYQNWQHSIQMLNKKREHKAKMELANRPDKGNIASNEITEWEAKVERCHEEFNNISKMIKKEMERFECVRVNDFKVVFIKHMEDQMKHQQTLSKIWESFLPEAKSIS